MIDITKKIAHKLNKEYGIPFKDGGISVSGTRRKYYLCPNKRNLSALNEIQKNPT